MSRNHEGGMTTTDEQIIEAMARAECKRRRTGECAAICLSYMSAETTDGKCPEASQVFGREMVAALAAARPLIERAMVERMMEPSEKMLIAAYGPMEGVDAAIQFATVHGFKLHDKGDPPITRAWRAMVRAFVEEQGDAP